MTEICHALMMTLVVSGSFPFKICRYAVSLENNTAKINCNAKLSLISTVLLRHKLRLFCHQLISACFFPDITVMNKSKIDTQDVLQNGAQHAVALPAVDYAIADPHATCIVSKTSITKKRVFSRAFSALHKKYQPEDCVH